MSSNLVTKALNFVVCVGGIYGCYLQYGYLQEKIYHTTYSNGKKYTATSGIMLGQMLMSFLIAAFISRVVQRKTSNPISYKYSIITGICNTGSVYLGNNALRFCSYLVLALVKSSKILSILMVTFLIPIENERIGLKKILTAVVTTAGIILFNVFSNTKEGKATETLGYFFAIASIFCDGLIGRFQGQIRNKFRPSSFQMMEAVSLVTLVGAILLSIVLGETQQFIEFMQTAPDFQWNWLMFSLLGALGQIFIYYTITTFGPLFCGFVTTTRKMMTIIFSIVVFHHSLSQGQWSGVVLVFIGVFADFWLESSKSHKPHGHAHGPSQKVETEKPPSPQRAKRD